MFSNPLVRRYSYSQLRLSNLLVFGTLYFSLLLILFFINGSIYQYRTTYDSLQDLYKSLFIQLAVLQFLILWMFMPINSSNVVPREIADKSFDFFRMLPLTSTQKTTGILFGRNIFCLIVALINLCLCALFGFAGQINRPLLIQLLVLSVSGSIALSCSTLLLSLLSFKKTNTSIPLLIIVGLFGFSPFIGILIAFIEAKKEAAYVHFLDYNVSILWLISYYVLVGAAWSFAGIIRRFRYEYEPLLGRIGAFLFYICYLFLVYALFHYYLLWEPFVPEGYPYAFSLVSLLPLIIIPFFSMRSFDKYIEITRQTKRHNGLTSKLFLRSNLLFNLLLFVLWAATVSAVCYFTQKSFGWLPAFWCFIFTAYLVMITLCEVYVLYQPGANKVGYLLGFIGGVYLILPLILAGVLDREYLAWFSPIGAITSFMENHWQLREIYAALIFNCILTVVPLWLIIKKYITISRLRSAIENRAK